MSRQRRFLDTALALGLGVRRRRRSTFRWALELSVILHLLLLFFLAPWAREVWPESDSVSPLFAVVPEQESPPRPPLEFEFVDLPTPEESPVSDTVPLSDLDRRAHGGVGEAEAASPGSEGNTPMLVQAEGADVFNRAAPPQQQGPPIREVPPPQPEPEPAQPRPETEPVPEREPEGAGEPEQELQRPPEQPSIRLPPSDAWTLPPELGGLPENPDRKGGSVDAGGLSFDTQWYDWGPYAKKMLAKIRRNWRIPEIAMLGVSGRVQIRFFIERDGRVTGLQITDESGKPPMDFAARDAIAYSTPFDPLPVDLGGVEREGVTITFYYNMRREGR